MICARCHDNYDADPVKLALGNRLCEPCISRPRSTCFDAGVHPAHDWNKRDMRLWCPGIHSFEMHDTAEWS